MQTVDFYEDPLDREIELDPKSFRKNPYASMITNEQKLDMLLRAAFVGSNMTKEEFKNRVDLVLA